MWYVVQVATGREQTVCSLIERAAHEHLKSGNGPILEECFSPTYQHERKFRGEYKLLTRSLFPGYVIAITKNVIELNNALRRVSAFTKILGNDKAFIPLDRAEIAFIDSFTAQKHRVIQTSRAVSEGDQIRVIEGPMIGHEAWIKKINRRKSTAQIEMTMFGRTVTAEIGLAVVTKVQGRVAKKGNKACFANH